MKYQLQVFSPADNDYLGIGYAGFQIHLAIKNKIENT
jgi:hypothetical protein